MICNSYETFFDVMSQKTRIKIIEALNQKPMCVKEICNNLKEEQSKISHNLKKLTDCNFLTVKQNGKKRIYSVNEETIIPLLKIVQKHVNKYCCNNCIKNTVEVKK